MFGVNWSDPQTLWLNLMNAALVLVVVAALVALAVGVVWELAARRKVREARALAPAHGVDPGEMYLLPLAGGAESVPLAAESARK